MGETHRASLSQQGVESYLLMNLGKRTFVQHHRPLGGWPVRGEFRKLFVAAMLSHSPILSFIQKYILKVLGTGKTAGNKTRSLTSQS